MTISGVKILINSNINKLDDRDNNSLKADYFKSLLKLKSRSLLEKINKLKTYGKKHILKFVWFQKATQIVSLFTMQKPTKGEKAKSKLKLKIQS